MPRARPAPPYCHAESGPLSVSSGPDRCVAGRLAIAGADSHWSTYPVFLAYFDRARPLTSENFVIGASVVYSWMPTMLDLRLPVDDTPMRALQEARATGFVSDDQLLMLAHVVNNSVVGASKLLHFVAPTHFAIWDSRVAAYLGTAPRYGAAGDAQYRAYNESCRAVAKDPRGVAAAEVVRSAVNCDISALRAVEYVMYGAALNGLTYSSP